MVQEQVLLISEPLLQLWIFFLCVLFCLNYVHAYNAYKGQKRIADPSELKLTGGCEPQCWC